MKESTAILFSLGAVTLFTVLAIAAIAWGAEVVGAFLRGAASGG